MLEAAAAIDGQAAAPAASITATLHCRAVVIMILTAAEVLENTRRMDIITMWWAELCHHLWCRGISFSIYSRYEGGGGLKKYLAISELD